MTCFAYLDTGMNDRYPDYVLTITISMKINNFKAYNAISFNTACLARDRDCQRLPYRELLSSREI